jgi:hypothetical protein
VSDRTAAIAAVRRALDETEAEYAQLPLVVRVLVRRGFVKRTGHDFAAWRQLLAAPAPAPELRAYLDALATHYRGAPERARRGRGATEAQLAIIEQRSLARATAATMLRQLLDVVAE